MELLEYNMIEWSIKEEAGGFMAIFFTKQHSDFHGLPTDTSLAYVNVVDD